MAVNAMWYGAIKTTTPADALINFDNVFSWEEILVGMVSSLIVFPINLAIVTLFRKSKNKVGMEDKCLFGLGVLIYLFSS